MADNNSMSSKSSANTTSSADHKDEMCWDFRFGGDDSPRSLLPPRKPNRGSMFSSVAPSSSPPSSPPSSVEKKKKHGVLCRLKTAIKTSAKSKGKEFKENPRVTIIKNHQELMLGDEEFPFKHQDIRRARLILGVHVHMEAGRISGSVGERLVRVLAGVEVVGEKEFAAFVYRAVLHGEVSAARAAMILGVSGDSGV